MEYLFDVDKPHWAALHRVYDRDDISWPNFTGFTPDTAISSVLPLYYAVLCGFYDLTKQFISKNPEHVNSIGRHMVTPLFAALNRNLSLLQTYCVSMVRT